MAPVAQKIADEVVFDVSKVKESSFFKSDLTDPPQIFDSHLLENTDNRLNSKNYVIEIFRDFLFSILLAEELGQVSRLCSWNAFR